MIAKHAATARQKCYQCGQTIFVGETMLTTYDAGIVTLTHVVCKPVEVPSKILGLVDDALRAAKELS